MRQQVSIPPQERDEKRREAVAVAIFNEVMRRGGTDHRRWADKWVTEKLRDKYRLEADAAIAAVRIFDNVNGKG